jgi:hypothetical protein
MMINHPMESMQKLIFEVKGISFTPQAQKWFYPALGNNVNLLALSLINLVNYFNRSQDYATLESNRTMERS